MTDSSDSGGTRGPHGTRFFGGPTAPAGAPREGRGAEGDASEGRSAQLPDEPPPASWAAMPAVPWPAAPKPGATPLPRGPGTGGQGPAEPTPLPLHGRRSEFGDRPIRESLLLAMKQQRTTFYEVGDLARRLSVIAPGLAEASLVTKQLAVSFAIALVVVLLGTMVIAAGTLRLVLGVLAGTVATALAMFAALRVVSRLGSRRGAKELPGSALIWVGGVVFVVISATTALTWGVSEATRSFGEGPRRRPAPSSSAAPLASAPAGVADAKARRGSHTNVGRAVLYMPPDFSAPDGAFDLVVHYHGNTELVEQSVAAAKLNALVVIINLGDGSDKYSKPLQNPVVFDQLLGSIEASAESGLGLATPRIRRIALSAWSAGYGALYHILSGRSRFDRIDAVLLTDSMHASFATGSTTEVHPVSLKPFVAFARRAAAGERLMVLTHSAIETEGYASTTQTSNALIAALGLTRKPVSDPAASPPPMKMPVAVNAFPTGERRWLTVTSEAHQGGLTILGCRGNGMGDHIAHLAQMSVTVLPPLVERWR